MFWRFGKLTIALGGRVAQNREKGSKPILRPVPTFTLTFISTVATQGWPYCLCKIPMLIILLLLPCPRWYRCRFYFLFQSGLTTAIKWNKKEGQWKRLTGSLDFHTSDTCHFTTFPQPYIGDSETFDTCHFTTFLPQPSGLILKTGSSAETAFCQTFYLQLTGNYLLDYLSSNLNMKQKKLNVFVF